MELGRLADRNGDALLVYGLTIGIAQLNLVIARAQSESVVVSEVGREASVDIHVVVLILVMCFDLHFTIVRRVSRRIVVVTAIREERIVKERSPFDDYHAVPELC